MAQRITVTPSYGRDYTSKKAALADWAAGKDFTINDFSSRYDGSQINKPQADQAGLTVMIRYKRLTQVAEVKPCGNCGC